MVSDAFVKSSLRRMIGLLEAFHWWIYSKHHVDSPEWNGTEENHIGYSGYNSRLHHSSDHINAGQAIITLERNCRFKSLKMKLGRLKRHCNDMGTLMAALVKYVDSDNTKDPNSDEEKPEKGKKNGGAKGQQHNQGSHGNNGKRKVDNSDFVANTNVQGNMQRRKGKPP